MGSEPNSSNCRILQQPGAEFDLLPRHFELDHWLDQPGTEPVESGGRGGSLRILLDGRMALLRRYYRGGMVGRLLTDQYLWLGRDISRPWREWRILERAREAGLPVPEALGACVCRHGLIYTAAIITAWIEHSQTFAARLSAAPLDRSDWYRLGVLLKKMQAQGIRHADLNATNILIDREDNFHLIDFDKARIMNRLDDWQWRPLFRLQRSLEKIDRGERIHYDGEDWQALMDGYES